MLNVSFPLPTHKQADSCHQQSNCDYNLLLSVHFYVMYDVGCNSSECSVHVDSYLITTLLQLYVYIPGYQRKTLPRSVQQKLLQPWFFKNHG